MPDIKRVLIKYVKKAKQWCVTEISGVKGDKQKQTWFSDKIEAENYQSEVNKGGQNGI